MMGQEGQRSRCNHVKNVEDKYLAKEPAVNEITGNFLSTFKPDKEDESNDDLNAWNRIY